MLYSSYMGKHIYMYTCVYVHHYIIYACPPYTHKYVYILSKEKNVQGNNQYWNHDSGYFCMEGEE